MMLVRTYIAPSEIQGLGVCAGEFIPGGSHLWVLNPKFDIFLYREKIATLPAHEGSTAVPGPTSPRS